VPKQLPERLSELLGRLRERETQRALTEVDVAKMSDEEVRATLNQYLDLASSKLPNWIAQSLKWLREPSRRLMRIGAGVAMIVGGLLAFLPVLGVWMLPLGLILLSQDISILQRPVLKALAWTLKTWQRVRGTSQRVLQRRV